LLCCRMLAAAAGPHGADNQNRILVYVWNAPART